MSESQPQQQAVNVKISDEELKGRYSNLLRTLDGKLYFFSRGHFGEFDGIHNSHRSAPA